MVRISRRSHQNAAGFSLVEVIITVAILSVMFGMATGITASMIRNARADSGAVALVQVIEIARNQAASERREFQLVFTAPNQIQVFRIEVPAASTLIVNRYLENNQVFVKFPSVSDTPDAFATGTSAVDFGSTPTIRFTADGSLLDSSGDVVNGTVFLGEAGQPSTARAVTVFGATGLVRDWKWNGLAWSE